MLTLLVIVVGVVVVVGGGILLLGAVLKKSDEKGAREAGAARGQPIGDWTVYYDVKTRRIGLVASFGEGELLRYLVMRAHDLFDYNQGLKAEQARLGEALRAAARGASPEPWQLLFPAPESELFHAYDRPLGTLFKFFDGKLYENAIDQPRFLGGDAVAKQQGLVGEVLAIASHLAADPARAAQVARAVDRLVDRELAEGTARRGAAFWDRPNDALRLS